MECSNCRAALGPTDAFCHSCGARSARPPITASCTSCGAPLPPANQFCNKCGVVRPVALLAPRCSACGASSPIESSFCGQCGAPLLAPALPSQPPIEESEGARRGESWSERQAPSGSPRTSPGIAEASGRAAGKLHRPGCFTWLLILLGMAALGVCGLAFALVPDLKEILSIAIGPGGSSTSTPGRAVTAATTTARPPTTGTPARPAPIASALSAQQKQVYDDFGWPHSFSLLDVGDAAGKSHRHETWTYYDAGVTYVFVDGAFARMESAESLASNIVPTPYRPNRVALGMSLEAVQSIAVEAGGSLGDLPFASLLMTGLPGGFRAYYAKQMVVALREGRLVYFEALAVTR